LGCPDCLASKACFKPEAFIKELGAPTAWRGLCSYVYAPKTRSYVLGRIARNSASSYVLGTASEPGTKEACDSEEDLARKHQSARLWC